MSAKCPVISSSGSHTGGRTDARAPPRSRLESGCRRKRSITDCVIAAVIVKIGWLSTGKAISQTGQIFVRHLPPSLFTARAKSPVLVAPRIAPWRLMSRANSLMRELAAGKICSTSLSTRNTWSQPRVGRAQTCPQPTQNPKREIGNSAVTTEIPTD